MVPEFSGESSVDGLSSCGQEPTSRILGRWCVRAGKRGRKTLGSCKGPFLQILDGSADTYGRV